MFHFSFNSLKSRLLLASMHYNENARRNQQQNKQGDMQYAIAFPKYKKGGYIVRKILTRCTYNYIDDFFKKLIDNLHNLQAAIVDNYEEAASLRPLCANYTRPNKLEAVKQHTTQFTTESK